MSRFETGIMILLCVSVLLMHWGQRTEISDLTERIETLESDLIITSLELARVGVDLNLIVDVTTILIPAASVTKVDRDKIIKAFEVRNIEQARLDSLEVEIRGSE